MRKYLKKHIALITIVAALVTGCGANQTNNTNSVTDTTVESTDTTDTTESTTTSTVTAIATDSQVVVDTEFTANDLEVGYEDSTAIDISLNGNTIAIEESSSGATTQDGILTISDEGTYVITGTLTDGQIVVEAEDTDKVQIVLKGVNITNTDSAAIYIKTADKVFITLEENTENTLTDGSEYVQIDDNKVDGVIFSTADLTMNGEGTLVINGNYKHGIASKDDLIITGGTYNINAVKDALNGKDCVKIKDGTFNITVTDGNGIQSKNGDDTTKGYVYICGGEINVLNCQEGIEGTAIIIDDGTINIIAQDDGLNSASGDSTTQTDASTSITQPDTSASSTEDDNAEGFAKGDFGGGKAGMENDSNCYISISGGTINVDAVGDGIDSNGAIYISGGTTYVSGPTDNNNAGMDYNGTADITGGAIVVAGSSGMAQGFSETSTQYSLLYNFTTACAAGTKVELTDADGNVVVTYTPNKQYQSVVISTPELIKDATYTITSTDQTAEITLSSVATSGGEQGAGGGGFGGRGGNGQRPDGGMGRPGDDTTPDNSDSTQS